MGFPHYSRAPITEAVIDLRVASVGGIDIERIKALADSLRADFPVQSPMVHGQFELAISADPKKVHLRGDGQRQIGVRLANHGSKRVLQITVSGFTFSHLPPYSDWRSFRAEAAPLWDAYVRGVEPEQVVRIALRYINRLDLPGTNIEPYEYLNLYPKVPPEIPPDITGMFMQLRMPQDDIDAMAIINSSLVDSEREDAISVILDFDLFQASERVPGDHRIWTTLDQISERKNLLFNACLTDKAKEMYL